MTKQLPNIVSPIILIDIRESYGRVRTYPMNTQAKNVCRLTGRSTLTDDDVAALKVMGFTIEEVKRT